ncbi:hypothetical protein I7I48_06408 [Histoplasma ohiense]|nr:hypothetical protein I7I48_06408 [Histoplasma ohiense (nom. inval.)]
MRNNKYQTSVSRMSNHDFSTTCEEVANLIMMVSFMYCTCTCAVHTYIRALLVSEIFSLLIYTVYSASSDLKPEKPKCPDNTPPANKVQYVS